MRIPTDSSIAAARKVFVDHGGVMRTGEALAAGIHRRTLYWMRDQGHLEQLSRGVFHLASERYPENPDVAVVMRRVPNAVLCLVSALSYHEIGTQIPRSVQIALPRSTRVPAIDIPSVRVFTMSDAAYSAGIEERTMGETRVRVYGIAKTVADCFKYRNKIGLDIAIEALQEVIRERRTTPAEIMEYAAILRVSSVIKPYLMALL